MKITIVLKIQFWNFSEKIWKFLENYKKNFRFFSGKSLFQENFQFFSCYIFFNFSVRTPLKIEVFLELEFFKISEFQKKMLNSKKLLKKCNFLINTIWKYLIFKIIVKFNWKNYWILVSSIDMYSVKIPEFRKKKLFFWFLKKFFH